MTKPRYANERARAQAKAIRHQISVLKRKGLVAKDVNAAQIKLTQKVHKKTGTVSISAGKSLDKALRENEKIIRGIEKTQSVDQKRARKLKQEGYTIVHKKGQKTKVILEKSLRVTKSGDVVDTIAKTKARRLRKDVALELQINQAIDSLKPGQALGFKAFGYDGYRAFTNAEHMMEWLSRYTPDKSLDELEELAPNLTLIVTDNPREYLQHAAEFNEQVKRERFKTGPIKRKRRRKRR